MRASALQLWFPPTGPAHQHVPGSLPLAFLLPLQGLLKKHEAFETDFTVHKDRVNDVCSNGQDLIKKVSLACWGDTYFPHPTPLCWGHRGPQSPCAWNTPLSKVCTETRSHSTAVFHHKKKVL